MAHDVFISYSSEDRLTADAVCNALENAKIRCWIAPRDVVPGRDYGRDIIDALKASKIMVVVFSADCDRSEQVMNEVERAVNSRLIIIPFRIENVEPTGSLEFHLSRRHWLDALTPPLEKHLKKLCVAVQRNLPSPEVQGEPVRPGIETGREPGRPTPEPPSALVLPAAQVIPKPPFLSPEAPPESDSHTPEPQTESNTDPLPFRPKPESISSDEPPLGLRTLSEVKPEPVISQPTPHREPDVARSKIPGFVRLIAVLIALAVFYLVIAPPAYMRRLITIIWPDRNQELLQAAQQNEWQRVQDLLSRGASINGVKSDGTSVLMIAAAKGEREVVKLLLEGGADVNAKDGAGATALIMASGKGHLEVVKQLLSKGADVNAKDSRGSTALLLASRSGDLQTVKLLIDMGANVNARREDGSTPLMMAARNCQLEVVKLLLTKGADVHAKVNDGSTALLLAASSEDRTDATASTSCQEVLSLLLAKGADVNDASNSRGRTPLMAAVIQGHPEVVKLLLAKGANIDIKDKEGKTALTHASEQGHVEVANLVKEWDSAIRRDLRELKTLLVTSQKVRVRLGNNR